MERKGIKQRWPSGFVLLTWTCCLPEGDPPVKEEHGSQRCSRPTHKRLQLCVGFSLGAGEELVKFLFFWALHFWFPQRKCDMDTQQDWKKPSFKHQPIFASINGGRSLSFVFCPVSWCHGPTNEAIECILRVGPSLSAQSTRRGKSNPPCLGHPDHGKDTRSNWPVTVWDPISGMLTPMSKEV